VALIASPVLVLVGPYSGGFRDRATATISRIDFNEVVLRGMLGFLPFAGVIKVNLDDPGQNESHRQLGRPQWHDRKWPSTADAPRGLRQKFSGHLGQGSVSRQERHINSRAPIVRHQCITYSSDLLTMCGLTE
jgi:hypothetical protein